MGLGLFSSSSYDEPNVIYEEKVIYKKLPNPDPYNYKIVRAQEVNNNLLVMINYPDCTNYEGNKILAFKNYTVEKLLKRKSVDPHFSNNTKFKNPVARFEPTDLGWNLGLFLIKNL